MVGKIKRILYFPIAYYFRFWAKIQLFLWKPRIIVITGSSGKTTLLHLLESQLGKIAKYSHHANSSYGIPFDILGLTRKKLTPDEWIFLFFLAPFRAFKSIPKEKLYVVEADCDRPGEGKFLASFLQPEITLWISSSLTHSINFDRLVKNNNFKSVDDAIAYEFGFFLEYTKKLAIINGDSSLIKEQLVRTAAQIIPISQASLKSYKILKNRTEFNIEHKKYSINFITPKGIFYSIQMTIALLDYLKIRPDYTFSQFSPAPGRCSLFSGIKNTTIIDSTYNATPDGVKNILEMFDKYPSRNKWLILGDMIELGDEEKVEHEKIGRIISKMKLEKIILIGPRVSKYIPPILPISQISQTFLMPKEALDYILKNIKGEEAMLFKGARFLEGVIEHLLQDKKDVNRLVRREKAWQNRRKAWGL
ncbi:MAG: hypothetical protein HY425_02850 [Candidatus Levybacteria bacterium]|nr:hypothetical protein [Candidatus Levybacteria bacterium]